MDVISDLRGKTNGWMGEGGEPVLCRGVALPAGKETEELI